MRRILSTILLSIILFSAYGQEKGFTGDAVVVSQKNNNYVIRTSGLHEKRKEAEAVAIRSAFHAYLTKGITGLNNNRPLIDPSRQSDPRVANYINNIVNSRYSVFVGTYSADDKAEKSFDKMFKIFVNFELYNESLLRDLYSNNIIPKADDQVSLSETNDNMIMPTIMIVPRTQPNETIKGVLDSKSEYRSTTSKLAECFLKEGVETKNFDETYNGLLLSGALSTTMSSDDKILTEVSKGVDVVVYMDIKSNSNTSGKSVELSLTAVNASTKSTIATTSETSAYFKNVTTSHLSSLLAEAIVPSFMKQVSTSFARNLSRGQGISIRIELDPSSSADLNSEVGGDMFSIGDILRLWIKKNCKGGRYRTATQTPTLIIYDQIFITTQDEGGQFSDVNDFELELRQEMRLNGVTISKRLMDGNSIIYTLML